MAVDATVLDVLVDRLMAELPRYQAAGGEVTVVLGLDVRITIVPQQFFAAGPELSRMRLRRYVQEQIRQAFDLPAESKRRSRG